MFANETVECDQWVFDKSSHTIVQEWNITCEENKWKLAFVGTAHFAGVIVGSLWMAFGDLYVELNWNSWKQNWNNEHSDSDNEMKTQRFSRVWMLVEFWILRNFMNRSKKFFFEISKRFKNLNWNLYWPLIVSTSNTNPLLCSLFQITFQLDLKINFFSSV